MAYEDINNRYSKSFDATRAQLEANKKSKLADLQNQEADINNKYAQLLDTYNASKTQNQKHFYEQRNAADVANAQNAIKMNRLAAGRGWRGGTLAQINLEQDAQRTNALGAINSDENRFLSDLAMQQLNAKRDNTTALSQLANNRNLANEQFRLGLYGAQQENEFKKLAEIYAMQQEEKKRQWEAQQNELERAFKKQQQTEQLTSQKDIANMEYTNKNNTKQDEKDAWGAYYGLDDAMKWNFVNSPEDRQNIINAIGADGYAKMYADAKERINNNPGSDEILQNPNDPYAVLADIQPKQQKSLASPSWYDRVKNWLGW